jgi:hypothetical protein
MTFISQVLKLDIFSIPISLNFNRKKSLPTCWGLLLTFVLYSVLFAYAQQRFFQLVNRKNPIITQSKVLNNYDESDVINLNEVGFKMAFGVIDYDTGEVLSDSDYIEWRIYAEYRKDLLLADETFLAFHKCTEEDFKEFYPVTSASGAYLQILKDK